MRRPTINAAVFVLLAMPNAHGPACGWTVAPAFGWTVAPDQAPLPGGAQVTFLDETFAHDPAHPAAGHWIGTVSPQGGPAVMAVMHITHQETSGWSAAVTLLFAGAIGKDAGAVVVTERSIAVTLPGPRGAFRFEAELSDDAQRLRGHVVTLREGQAQPDPAPLELARTPRPVDLPRTLAYSGKLEFAGMGGIATTLVFATTPGGHWVGHMDVPSQGLVGYPLVNVVREGDRITADALMLPAPNVRIEVTLNDDERRLAGSFKQGPYDLAIDFERNDEYAAAAPRRPQHPQPPLPYAVQDVTITHPAGHTLAGTLSVPQGTGPFPAVVTISGSGPQDRDETVFGHKPFAVLADCLTRHGIAVLRYDDRGIGGSGGTFQGATSRDFATDAAAAVEFLTQRDEIDRRRIGLIGHSEGGMVAPMVAGMRDDIAFMVLLAGTAVTGEDILRVQEEKLLRAGGADDPAVARHREQQEAFFKLTREKATPEAMREQVRRIVEIEAAASGVDPQELEPMVERQLAMMTSEWMSFFLTYDPRPALAALRCPVLALNGTLDLQVWHEQNLDEIERVMREAGGDVTARRYPGLNHLFQPATTGAVGEYFEIETTIDERVLSDIVEWIRQKVGREAPPGPAPDPV